jgi:hypothetical protein
MVENNFTLARTPMYYYVGVAVNQFPMLDSGLGFG